MNNVDAYFCKTKHTVCIKIMFMVIFDHFMVMYLSSGALRTCIYNEPRPTPANYNCRSNYQSPNILNSIRHFTFPLLRRSQQFRDLYRNQVTFEGNLGPILHSRCGRIVGFLLACLKVITSKLFRISYHCLGYHVCS